MQLLPTGRQNFKAIIEEGLLYVDKTRQIHEIVTKGNLYFLARPRRFGKSLLVSTFKHLFSGHKELFADLYIGKEVAYKWEEYPVLQFNFASYGAEVVDLEAALKSQIEEYGVEYGIELSTVSLPFQFKSLIERIAEKGKPVVVLIDEYDKPIVDFLLDIEKARKNQRVLRNFFSPLKSLEAEGHLRFLFITGVSKFSKVSLFSDLNNLTDLSMHPWSKDLLGITQIELLQYFDAYIEKGIEVFNILKEELLKRIKLWYNGYSFDGEIRLYNPFSILHFFEQNRFGNFWFATGTPTFLVNTIRDRGVDPKSLENKKVDDLFFDKFSLKDLNMAGLLFQTGYLTIKKTSRRKYDTYYYLDYPNIEVKRSFYHNLIQSFTYRETSIVSDALIRMQEGLEEGIIAVFVEQLEVLLSDISYHLSPNRKKSKKSEFEVWEGYFQTIIYLVTSFMGLYVQTEITKHQGRLDLLAETEDYLYLMEFKLEESAENAIQQIKQRKYAAAYKNSTKIVYLVGINFSKEERNVSNWKAEIWDRT
ncbi:MAG: AAA family ATPase [Saprospiraceae bacterium]